MTKKELGQSIMQIAHLKGEFKLRSGKISNEYFDKYRFEAQPKLLKAIAEQMVPLIPKDTEILAGLEVGGIPIATALSLQSGLPCVFVRKTAKDYGTCRLAEGMEIKGKRVCVIEDVITTGGQVLLSTKDLRDLGAKVDHVLCAIYRAEGPPTNLEAEGLKVSPLFTMEELKGI